jgi:hypothetical protein
MSNKKRRTHEVTPPKLRIALLGSIRPLFELFDDIDGIDDLSIAEFVAGILNPI